MSPWLCGRHRNHIFWCGHGNVWPYSGGMASAMMAAMGNFDYRVVVMANGMMVAMGNVDDGVVVWPMGWRPCRILTIGW